MTKMIKMSLIAAVAVTGMTSAANAQNLEDAIKGVDVSGYVDYRHETTNKTNTATSNVNEYSVNVTLKSKVNDIVSATVSAGFDEVVLNERADKDTSAPVGVDQAYFSFALPGATVMAGKQNIPSVFVDQVDTVKTGAGIVALSKVSDSLTIAGAHFWQNNIVANAETTELIAMAKVAGVNFTAHYNETDLNANVAKPESKRLFLKVDGDVAGVKVFAQNAKADADLATKDASVTIVGAAGNVGSLSLDAKYFAAKDNNTANATVAIDGDDDAKVNAKVWQLSTKTGTDLTGYVVTAGMKLSDNVEAKLVYAQASDDESTTVTKDYTEIMPMITYKMSKNFSLHGRYSMLTTEQAGRADVDQNKSRIEVKYTF